MTDSPAETTIRVGQVWRDSRAKRMDRTVVAYTPGAKIVTLYDWTRQRHALRVSTLRKHFRLLHDPAGATDSLAGVSVPAVDRSRFSPNASAAAVSVARLSGDA